jgi:ATP-dependent DNA helicase RecG
MQQPAVKTATSTDTPDGGRPLTFDGLTPYRRTQLAKLGIFTTLDLLNWLPRRYEEFQAGIAIDQIKPGQRVSVEGMVIQTRLHRRRPMRFEVLLEDRTGRCVLTWFNRRDLADKIKPETLLQASGKAGLYKGRLQLTQPDFKLLDKLESALPSDGIEPVYPATADVSKRFIAELVARHLDECLEDVVEWFTPEHLAQRHLVPLRQAYRQLHKPGSMVDITRAQRTIAYHEIILFQLALELRRYHQKHSVTAEPLRTDDRVDERIRALIPFELTVAQNRVIAELRRDLARREPMNRLLQGDVGSGKTVVALYAMLMAVAAGKQAALLAPTEILAEQHYYSITNLLAKSRVQVELLTAGVPAAKRADVLEKLSGGDLHLIVGTHALLSEPVEFKHLALLVVDEQHKFGVEQRAMLRHRQANVHTLVMTATPIPRTLAMTYFGDLDVSIIDGLPPGRHPIATRKVTGRQLPEVYAYIQQQLQAGRQAYVVAPAIEEGVQELDNVNAVLADMATHLPPNVRIEPLHSRLTADQRRQTMERFRSGEIHVLVSTTIIEVGVDVPNATIMLIRQAERFGLAQLHQLRGRIGRSNLKSVCILCSDDDSEEAQARLDAMVKNGSGFRVAEEDLRLRGMGQMVGTRQSGMPEFLYPDFLQEIPFLQMTRRDAATVILADPHLIGPEHARLRHEVYRRYQSTLLLADVA